jgi:hypothetical protein
MSKWFHSKYTEKVISKLFWTLFVLKNIVNLQKKLFTKKHFPPIAKDKTIMVVSITGVRGSAIQLMIINLLFEYILI